MRRLRCTVVGAADAGGHTHEQNIVPGFQNRIHRVDILVYIDLGGCHDRPSPDGVVVGAPIKLLRAGAGNPLRMLRRAVKEGNQAQSVFADDFVRQVGGRIGKNHIIHV